MIVGQRQSAAMRHAVRTASASHVSGRRRIRGDTSASTARPSTIGRTYQSPIGRSSSAIAVRRSARSRDVVSSGSVVVERAKDSLRGNERSAFELHAPDGDRH